MSPLGLIRPAVAGFLLCTCVPLQATHFVAADSLDYSAILPAPPAADSFTTRAELDVIYAMQVDRTPAQVAFARTPPNDDVFAFGGPVLGSWFTAENLPQTMMFFARIDADAAAIAAAAKAAFPERARPYVADPRIDQPLSRPGGGTYPGGHAFIAAYRAALLAGVFPDLAAPLQERARTIAWSRVIAGLHYPTDNVAGRTLGVAFVERLHASAAFVEAADAARRELQAARAAASR